jgi:hypothetical protein
LEPFCTLLVAALQDNTGDKQSTAQQNMQSFVTSSGKEHPALYLNLLMNKKKYI